MFTLMDILAEYGVVSAIIASCVAVTFILLRGKLSSNVQLSSSVKDEEDCCSNIRNHDFFSNLEFKINIDLPIETFSPHHNRNVMYRDIMIYLFESYLRNMKAFTLNIKSIKKASHWSANLHSTHYDIIEEFKESCIRNGIPEEALDLFLTWYNPHVSRIYQYISIINKIPNTNVYGKTRTFLLVLELILATITADAQRAPKLNGELDGLVYKDLTL